MSDFSFRRACIFRRLTAGKSRDLQDEDEEKGTVRRAARLCVIALMIFKGLSLVEMDQLIMKLNDT